MADWFDKVSAELGIDLPALGAANPGNFQTYGNEDDGTGSVSAPLPPANAPPQVQAPPQTQHYPQWMQTPAGQNLINQLIAGFGMSEAEAKAHLNYQQMPDSRFFGDILLHLRRARQQPGQTQAPANASTATGNRPANAAEFWRLFKEARANYPGNPAGLAQLVKDHPEWGLTVVGGSGGDIQLPDWLGGGTWDVMLNAGANDSSTRWADEPFQSQGGEGGNQYGQLAGNSLLDPFTQQFQYPSFEPPPAFQAPTAQEAFDDPGFQFTLERGLKALERSAAAKGTLLTTGTLEEQQGLAQGMASTQYDKVYGRRLGEYENRYGHATQDYERDYNKALGEFRQGYDIFAANQDRPFNKLTTLAGLGAAPGTSLLNAGQGYAGQYGSTLMNGAGAYGNYLTQGANAQAAGQVGSANAMAPFYNYFGQMLPYLGQGGQSGYRPPPFSYQSGWMTGF